MHFATTLPLLAVLSVLSAGATAASIDIAAVSPDDIPARDGARDFDFLFGGRWRIDNHRLVGRLQGSTTWEDFTALGVCEPLAGGIGNVDTFTTDHWPGFAGATLRFYDPKRQEWSLYWVDNRTGVLQPPVVGRWDGAGTGVFDGDDVLDGRPIRVRFLWKKHSDDHATWAQAFSGDGGRSWETNWTMDLRRIGAE